MVVEVKSQLKRMGINLYSYDNIQQIKFEFKLNET
jgi:hypothetical protein